MDTQTEAALLTVLTAALHPAFPLYTLNHSDTALVSRNQCPWSASSHHQHYRKLERVKGLPSQLVEIQHRHLSNQNLRWEIIDTTMTVTLVAFASFTLPAEVAWFVKCKAPVLRKPWCFAWRVVRPPLVRLALQVQRRLQRRTLRMTRMTSIKAVKSNGE